MTHPVVSTVPLAAPLPSQEAAHERYVAAAPNDDPADPRVEYTECRDMWDLCAMLKEGTPSLHANAGRYLPKFPAEETLEYQSRRDMTFLDDHYAQTVDDLVGLAFADPPTLNDDVADELRPFLENVNGEGDAWDVFLQHALEEAIDFGHAGLWTDYPTISDAVTKKDVLDRDIRPYWTLYRATDIPRWTHTVIGGVRVLTKVSLREKVDEQYGELGAKVAYQYRVIEQEVIRDDNDRPVRLGKITWELKVADDLNKKVGDRKWKTVDSGNITGPSTIPLRIIYGGRRLGPMRSRPHLVGLAYTNWEEVQVKSDFANVMHKCNVPTAYFIGRVKTMGQQDVKMGSGIDLTIGGSCGFMEPAGNAINATMKRIEEIRGQMRRQGAMLHAKDGQMTATEAELYARQRNARLSRAVRSLQDMANAGLGDMAQFVGLEREAGGTIRFTRNFAGNAYDPQFVSLVAEAYEKGALPLDVYLYALKAGKLPDEFNAEETALRMLGAALRERKARAQAAGGEPDDEDDEGGGGSREGGATPPVKGEGKAEGGLGGG